jgi:branched-chain amino acid transport system permease protein
LTYEYWMLVLTMAGINAIVTIGLYVCMLTRQLNVAQAAFMGIGGYTAGIMTTRLGFPIILALVGGGLVAGVIACLLALVIARLRMWIFAVATLAFGEIMVNVCLNIEYVGGAVGFHGIPTLIHPWAVFLVLGILVFLYVRFEHSRSYQVFLFTGDDEVVAKAMGINVTLIRFIAFSLGSLIAGIGGGLEVHYLGGIQADVLSFSHSFFFLIFLVVGGERSFWGAITGAVILTILPEILRFSLYERYILYGIILVLVLVFWPNGLLRRRRLMEKNWLTALSINLKGKIK